MANAVDLMDKLSPHFTIRHLKGEYLCPECQNDEIDISFDERVDGDLCLTDVLDVALVNNRWCDQMGVCPACKTAHAESQREADMVDDAREAVVC